MAMFDKIFSFLIGSTIIVGVVQDVKEAKGESHNDPIVIEQDIVKIPIPKPIPKDLDLIEAMIQVESRGFDSCVGDKHLIRPSIGVLQIRPIMVREVNNIIKRQGITHKFTLNDRYSRDKSIDMFRIWRDYHHLNDSYEVIARCWNGGPKGMNKKRTSYYWKKIQKHL